MRPDAYRLNVEMLKTIAFIGALACIATVSMGAWHAGAAQAASDRGKATVKVMVSTSDRPRSEDAEFERTKTEEITKMVVKRVRTRLEAARIKQFSIETEAPGTIVVTARGGVSHGLLAGIVVPQGRFELRPTESIGARWTKQSTSLPEGVELRQEKGSFAVDDAYLWSRSRATLKQAIAAASVEGIEVQTYPLGSGWRSVALAAPVATHEDVSKAAIRRGKTGDVFVQVKFNRDVSPEHIAPNQRRTWAVVLDSEIVATFERVDPDFGASLTLTSPEHLGSKEARRNWAKQVAGRLSAYMSVGLVEMEDSSK
jgi:hypothetical protein